MEDSPFLPFVSTLNLSYRRTIAKFAPMQFAGMCAGMPLVYECKLIVGRAMCTAPALTICRYRHSSLVMS